MRNKKLFLLLFALPVVLLILFMSNTARAEFKEGEHYQILPNKHIPKRLQVVYSVYCPYCELYEREVIPKIKLPAGMVKEDIYLANFGQYGQSAAKVLAVLKQIGENEYEAAKKKYFEEAVVKKEANIRNKGIEHFIKIGLDAAGVSEKIYIEKSSLPAVEETLAYWKDITKPVQNIPVVIVNGKYLVRVSSLKSMEMLNEVVEYLSKK